MSARTAGAPEEIAKFDAAAERWWDPDGPMAPLQAMQPARLAYILDQLRGAGVATLDARSPLAGRRVLDAGCGGGLLSEPMARLGAAVVGVDQAQAALAAARAHAARGGLSIDYRAMRLEDLAADVRRGAEPAFDAALSFEVLEHVSDRGAFLTALAGCLRPGGLAIVSTLNRTAASFLGGIVVAEYALGWLPRGTHDWRAFVPPARLEKELRRAGLSPVDRSGFVFSPLSRSWRRDDRDVSINYAMTAVRHA